MLPWMRPTPPQSPVATPDAEMLRPCPLLPKVAITASEAPIEAQVEAWQAWSLLVVRRYAECARRVDLWKAWGKKDPSP